jgi:hypothetical protein
MVHERKAMRKSSTNSQKSSPKGSSEKAAPMKAAVSKRKLMDHLINTNHADRALGNEKIASIHLLNKSIQAQFREQAKAFKLVLDDMPELSSVQVIRLCIHLALQKEDYESAARWAKELVEFEKPKLSRREVIDKNDEQELSDDELDDALKREGIVVDIKSARGKTSKRKGA